MKKILTILLISLSLCLLAGCGNTSKESEIFGTYYRISNPGGVPLVYTKTIEKEGDLYKITNKLYEAGKEDPETKKLEGKWDNEKQTLTLTNTDPLEFKLKEHTMVYNRLIYKKLTDETKEEFETAKQKALNFRYQQLPTKQ